MQDRNDLVVATLILDRPTCRECIARETGLGLQEIDPALERIRRVLIVATTIRASCRVCHRVAEVVSVRRPHGDSPPERGPTCR